MLLALLNSFSASLKPVILIPGTYASVLQMTGHDLGHQWYCPKSLNNTIIWIDEFYFIPPILNCVIQWAKVYYDSKNNEQVSHPNSTIDILDFGKLTGVTSIDKFIGNYSFIPYYTAMIDYFEKLGYQEGINLFGAPIDWRLGLAASEKVFHPRLIKLVEEIYAKTQQKVVLIGHSFGGYTVQNFLSNGASQEWIDKYIEKGIALAPSFGGAIESMLIAWTREIQKIITIKNEFLTEALETMGAVHIHFYNWELFPNQTVVYTPDGTEIKTEKFSQFLIDHQKINGDSIPLLKLNEKFTSKFPNQTKAPLYIIYNSGRQTATAFKLKDWDSDDIEKVYGEGDGTINAEGIRKYCNKYASNTHCYDFKDDGPFGNHLMMLYKHSIIKLTYQTVFNNSIF
ncbi:hypothetical protein M9Y10_020891 [Tritrichomonas musculus]|uniref:Lecithin:cholesterol acyltransferase family protein n=1 Tax=Tritrichomonas musculus TaxID=1915356 RepID=A0ABR2HFX9_9EUKA